MGLMLRGPWQSNLCEHVCDITTKSARCLTCTVAVAVAQIQGNLAAQQMNIPERACDTSTRRHALKRVVCCSGTAYLPKTHHCTSSYRLCW